MSLPPASSQAPVACATCRTQKRKCSRDLPVCALCKKHRRPCNYGDGPIRHAADRRRERSHPATSPGSIRSTTSSPSSIFAEGRSRALNSVEPTQVDFPAVFFLDSEYFQQQRNELDMVSLALPAELTGDQSQLIYNADIYFNSVHDYLPVVSKLRLYQEISKGNLNADTTLLLMAMQLHTQPVGNTEPSDRELYKTTKSCSSYIEASNTFSTRLLQANLLITLYEVSNAIFPAAYLSVGHCARVGQAMGIQDRKRAPQMLSAPRTSTELEERRRVWWGVTILDRYINIGIPSSPFAVEDTRPDEYLPIEDKYWDKGERSSIQPLAISANTTVQVCPFARTCQAAHVLSRVLRHTRDTYADAEFRYQEAMQLHKTVHALYSAVTHESEHEAELSSDPTAHTPLFTATGLCLSALMNLYYNYSCIEHATVEQLRSAGFLAMHHVAAERVKEVANAVYTLSSRVQAAAELGGMLKTSPLISDCLYQAAVTYRLYMEDARTTEYQPMLTGVRSCLELLGKRWRAPREYLKILANYSQLNAPVRKQRKVW